jgi:hypothetical protein
VSEPSLGGGAAVLKTILQESGFGKLYEGFPPLLVRQVKPPTFVNFHTFTSAAATGVIAADSAVILLV